MERRWILSAVAALAVSAPVMAEEMAPTAAPEPTAPVASNTPDPAAPTEQPTASEAPVLVAQATPAPGTSPAGGAAGDKPATPMGSTEEEPKTPKFTFGGQTDFY